MDWKKIVLLKKLYDWWKTPSAPSTATPAGSSEPSVLGQISGVFEQFVSDPCHLFFGVVYGCIIGFLSCAIVFAVSLISKTADAFIIPSFFAGLLVGVALYIATSLRAVPAKKAWAVERFGATRIVLLPGLRLLCRPGHVDRVVKEVSLKAVELTVFNEGKDRLIDFKGGGQPVTAEVSASAWVEIDQEGGDKVTEENVKKVVWVFSSGLERVRTTIADYLRPRLQGLSLEEAQKAEARRTIESELTDDPHVPPLSSETAAEVSSIRRAMAEVGYRLRKESGLTIADIDEPRAVIELNLETRRAEARKKAIETIGEGHREALKKMQKAGLTPTEAAILQGEIMTAEAIAKGGSSPLVLAGKGKK